MEKIITLPERDYQAFKHHLLKPYRFIRENIDYMFVRDGVRHCLLVTGTGCQDGVLVESEGADYARYTSYVPNMAMLSARKYQTLEAQNARLEAVIEAIIKSGRTAMVSDGLGFSDEIMEGERLSAAESELVIKMLAERGEVREVQLNEDGITVTYNHSNDLQMNFM